MTRTRLSGRRGEVAVEDQAPAEAVPAFGGPGHSGDPAGQAGDSGLLSRIEWDYPQYRDTHAPYLTLTPKEYFRRNCWAAVEGSEPEIEATAGLIGADRMCISTDYPHFDSNFPEVSNNLLRTVSRKTAAEILRGGAGLYAFTDAHFAKADAAAARQAPAQVPVAV